MSPGQTGNGSTFPEPLSEDAFYLLYQAALDADSTARLVEDLFLVGGLGRLGLHPSELTHCHEGWISWDAGSIDIPSHDPCICSECWESLESQTTSDVTGAVVADRLWAPPEQNGDRRIPFRHSRRLTAILDAFFDRHAFLDVDDVSARLTAIADRAPGLETSSVTPAVLRSSAASYFAALGYDQQDVAAFLSTDPEKVSPHVRSGVAAPTRTPNKIPPHLQRRFIVALHPEQIAGEPFDPEEYTPAWRYETATAQDTSSRALSNPRPPAIQDASSGDPSRRLPDECYLDPKSDLITMGESSAQSLLSALIGRQDNRDEPESTLGTSTESPGSDETRHQRDPSPHPDQADDNDSDSQTQDDTVDATVVAPQYETDCTLLSDELTNGAPIEVSFAITDDALVFDSLELEGVIGSEQLRLPLADITNVTYEYEDQQLAKTAETALGVAVTYNGENAIVGIGLSTAERQQVFATMFETRFANHGVVVTHPLKEGGVVRDSASPTTGMVTVENKTVHIYETDSLNDSEIAEDESPLVSIALERVIDISLDTFQRYDTTSWRSLEVTHLPDDDSTATTMTTQIALEQQSETKLFAKFVKGIYAEQMRSLNQLSFSAQEKQFLVGMHSFQSAGTGPKEIASMLGMDASEIGEMLDKLVSKGVMSQQPNPELTNLGQIAVEEKLDDVNM
jgi:helix-turn-helix protein